MLSLRWRIALLVSLGIAVSYFDRQTLPVAVTAIQRDIPLSNIAYSELQAAFLAAYAVMYAAGGKLIDTLGTRRGFLLIMVWWSLACAGHGLATSFGMLLFSRLLLGMGEGGGFPAATRVVAEWYSLDQRSIAMGIMNAGTAVGAVIAPPLIALVLGITNWRWVFFLSGAIGLLWSLAWWKDYFPPLLHPRLTENARRKILASLPEPSDDEASIRISWFQLLGHIETWALVTAKFLSDAAWYFYLFWLPKYLYDARGFDIKHVGYFAWIPYAASGVGCLAGGWLSAWLLRRGKSLNVSRKVALGLSAAVMPSILLVTHVPVQFALLLFSVAFFGQQSWSTLIMILPADLFPRSSVGSIAGLVGFGGAIGGVIFGFVVGYLLDHGFGYGTVFGAVSMLHIIAFLLILITIPVITPVYKSVKESA
ncbi:MAG TPA: MFS transporter [Alloacidobacterium sp.]|nr:MFS transporter [Alloacidobacterium sp.]